MPGLQARSPFGACKRLQIDVSHTSVSLPLHVSPFPSLKINEIFKKIIVASISGGQKSNNPLVIKSWHCAIKKLKIIKKYSPNCNHILRWWTVIYLNYCDHFRVTISTRNNSQTSKAIYFCASFNSYVGLINFYLLAISLMQTNLHELRNIWREHKLEFLNYRLSLGKFKYIEA